MPFSEAIAKAECGYIEIIVCFFIVRVGHSASVICSQGLRPLFCLPESQQLLCFHEMIERYHLSIDFTFKSRKQ